jgi:hypothetical protein
VRELRMPLLAAGIAVFLAAPGFALAQTASQPGSFTVVPQVAAAKSSKAATQTYDLTFTLPTAGKSGCMVCHGDPNLVRIENGQTVSMWISTAMISTSVHANVQCTGCHLDFAYSVPHVTPGNEEWRAIAKSACKNCHKEAFLAYSKGVHSPTPAPSQGATSPANTPRTPGSTNTDRKPLCGDCHGSHDIQKLKGNPAGQEQLHARGKQVCGQCHQAYWDNYNDSYHGSAYKRGARDAPACWQCHGPHAILNSKDPQSLVNEVNLVETCSRCHHNQPNDEYVSYSQLVHNRQDIYEENPIVAFWHQAIETVNSWFS